MINSVFSSLAILVFSMTTEADLTSADSSPIWQVDFFDDFESFNEENWQDQILWVNNEDQCYVRDNLYNTREVSGGTLKLRVVAKRNW